jgi:hypothetical protein
MFTFNVYGFVKVEIHKLRNFKSKDHLNLNLFNKKRKK